MNSTTEQPDLNSPEMQKIMNTLINLKALKDAAGTPGEAEAAAAGIQRLCFIHNLDMAQIGDKGEAQVGEKYSKNDWALDGNVSDPYQAWKLSLLDVIARYNFCMVLSYSRTRQVVIIGKPSNVALVKSLYEYFAGAVKRLTTKYWRAEYPNDYGRLNNTPAEDSFKLSFREGMVIGLSNRLAKQREEDLKAAGKGGHALVIDTAAELRAAYDEFYGLTPEQKAEIEKLRAEEQARIDAMTPEERAKYEKEKEARWKKATSSRGRRSAGPAIDYDVYGKGRSASNEVSLNKQVGAGEAKKAL
jgi:hypothetical protein